MHHLHKINYRRFYLNVKIIVKLLAWRSYPPCLLTQQDNGAIIPVEVKPNRQSPSPREADVMQLAAYAMLVEDTFHASPPYGLLKYRDDVFRIDFTDELRKRLLEIMDVMRQTLEANDVPRSHAEEWRCRGCGYRDRCGQVLGGDR